MNAAGAISSMLALNWRIWEKIATVIGCVSRAKVSATSRSFQTQRNWKIASDAIAGSPSGRISAEEDPELGGAVDPRRLEQVLRDPDEEVPQQEDRERQPEGGVEEHEPEDRVEQAEVVVQREDRDQRHLDGDDEQRDHDQEEPVAARELEPRERVGSESGDRDRQDRRTDGDENRRPDRRRDRLVVEDLAVVLERRQARLREDLPPACTPDLGGLQQRDEEQAKGRHQPEQPDEREQKVDGRPAQEANDS